jgi:hypothetical protein
LLFAYRYRFEGGTHDKNQKNITKPNYISDDTVGQETDMKLHCGQPHFAIQAGKMIKWKGKAASLAPSIFLGSVSVIALSVGIASADTINTAQTAPFVTTVDEDHTVTSTGSISVDPLNGPGVIEINVADYTSTLTNDGIVASNNVDSTQHTAIDINGNLSGTISNTGTVNISENSGSSALTLGGIDVSGVTSGTIENSGSINVVSYGSSTGNAHGIVTNGLAGQINNSGTLSVSASGSAANATGISTGDIAASGSLINTGTVSATANGTSLSAQAYGVRVGLLDGTINNSGNITATANAAARNAIATGFDIADLSDTGVITNTGVISAIANGTRNASALGFRLDRTDGDIVNSGSIIARGTVTSGGADASGMRLGSIVATGSVLNSGVIEANSTGSGGWTSSRGVFGSNVSGDFVNTGQISATTVETIGSDGGDATGILVSQIATTGRLINEGTISASATMPDGTSSYVLARGIRASQIDGLLLNSGTLSVLADSGLAGSAAATATGIGFQALSAGGTVSNSGSVSVAAIAGSGASAVGLRTRNPIDGTLNNSGSILGESVSGNGNANASGVDVSTVGATGVVNNSGTISATATSQGGSSSVNAYAAYVFNIDGTVRNSGTISATATAEGSGNAYANGLTAGRINVGASVVNSGTIVASVNVAGNGSGSAAGIENRIINGELINSGTIIATAHNEGGRYVSAYGIDSGGTMGDGAKLINSGTIDVSATLSNGVSALATGIGGANPGMGAQLINSGTINVSTINTGGTSAYARGVSTISVQLGGELVNSGSISVVAQAAGNSTSGAIAAHGIRVRGSLDGTLMHSGTIDARASGVGSEAYGIFAATMNGTMNVTGDILVGGADTNYGIYLRDGTGTLNIESTAGIDQTIRVADHNVNLTSVGGSAVYKFEDANTGAGTFVTSVTDPNSVWFTQGVGGVAPIYATVNGADLQINTLQQFQIGSLNEHLTNELDTVQSPTVSKSMLSFGPNSPSWIGGFDPYARIDFSRADRDTSRSFLASFSGGVTKDVGDDFRYGFGASFVMGNADTGPNDLDTAGIYLSSIAAKNFGFVDLSFGMGLGAFNHTNNRTVGGSADAVGKYSSTLWTAQVGAKRDFTLSNGMVLTPKATVRYGQQSLDGYTETGSLANATVAGRDVTFKELNIGATLAMEMKGGVFTTSLAAVRRDVDGPSMIDISVFGSSATLAADITGSDTLGEIGFGYEKSWDDNKTLTLQTTAGFGSGSSTQSLSALYEWHF